MVSPSPDELIFRTILYFNQRKRIWDTPCATGYFPIWSVDNLLQTVQYKSTGSQLLLLLFLTFSVLVANPKKLLYTVANPARGLLNREKRTKEKVWQHTPPPTPHTARSEKINKITRRIYRRYAGGRSRVRTRIPSARRLGLWVWLRNSTLPSAIIRFPVSLLLSSPGDV